VAVAPDLVHVERALLPRLDAFPVRATILGAKGKFMASFPPRFPLPDSTIDAGDRIDVQG
jgi:hypothetical protein